MLKRWTIRDGEDGRAGGAFRFERLAVKVTRWRVVLAGVGAATYAVALIVMLPAEAAAPNDRDAVGTVWDGQMALDGGFTAGWSLRPLDTIARFGLAQDVRVMGPATALDGKAMLRPGRVLVTGLDGVASARLLSAVAPGLPFTCDADLRVAIAELALKGRPAGSGEVRGLPGDCTPTGGGAPTPLPALTGTLTSEPDATVLTLARADTRAAVLTARVSPAGAVNLTVEPGGVGVFPGVNAAVSLDTTL
ncbi:MAG: hypothetical protein V4701_09115 [Pseudomonadota bacterium]